MKMIHTFLITFLVGVFFGLPGSVDAWNSQKQYDQYSSSHTYDKGKRHHQRYDQSYPKYKRYKHYKKKHHRNTPSWKDYQRRLQHRFNFSPKRHYHRYNKSYDNNYTFSEGWELIRKDRPEKALDIFRRIAINSPYEGEAKIGYAIAAAQNNQMYDGVVAMRRALKYDPDSLNRVHIDDTLRRKIHMLTENYQSSFYGLSSSDKHFMVASLFYLMNDHDRCIEALEKNQTAHDQAVSTINLYRLARYEAYN